MFKQLLIVEDDPQTCRLLSKVAEHAGFTVTQAPTLDMAKLAFEFARFDVVLLDVQLQGERSLALLEAQLSTLQANQTQLVVMSAEAKYRAICESLGVEFFLHKPIDTRMLALLLGRLGVAVA
jgi:two-component system OmpR family response regulator